MKFKVSGICSLSVGENCVKAKDGIIDLPDEFEADPSWPRLYAELLRDPSISIEAVTAEDPIEEEEAEADAPQDVKAEADAPQDVKAEADALRAKLKEAGISFGPRTGIDKLRELVSKIDEGK